jgi:hypothetical protein
MRSNEVEWVVEVEVAGLLQAVEVWQNISPGEVWSSILPG